jgi:hypothetical protein
MRWQEQVTLTTYEMQWTVRYFSHKSKGWAEGAGTGAGALAYAKRKQSMWEQLSINSDRIFKVLNPAYKSPF